MASISIVSLNEDLERRIEGGRGSRGGRRREEKEAEEEDEKEEEKEEADINKQGEAQELTLYFKQGCHRWPSIRDLQSITRKNKAQED